MNNVIRNTLLELKNKNLEITPDNYCEEFFIQSKVHNKLSSKFGNFKDEISKLSLEEQTKIEEQNINTFFDLIHFFLKRIDNFKVFAYILNEILEPSIHNDIKKDIEDLYSKILKNPEKLLHRDNINEIKNITKKRIKNDKKIVRDKTEDFIKVTSLMSKYFDQTILESGNSSDKISNIKKELEVLNISDSSYRELSVMQTKLVNTIYDIENTMEKNKVSLLKSKTQFNDLQETVLKLQKELKNAKNEKNLDYLTNIFNRRGFNIEIEKIEKKYKIFGTKFAVVFYDIDYFKKINDTYGHDCGDAVLRTFSAVLKDLTRQEDILARYGGEEFIVLLNYIEENEIIKYLKRVKNIVENRDFIYKKHTIKVEFSAGLSFRNKYDTYEDAIKKADDLLYIAKNEGRNRIILDNGSQI